MYTQISLKNWTKWLFYRITKFWIKGCFYPNIILLYLLDMWINTVSGFVHQFPNWRKKSGYLRYGNMHVLVIWVAIYLWSNPHKVSLAIYHLEEFCKKEPHATFCLHKYIDVLQLTIVGAVSYLPVNIYSLFLEKACFWCVCFNMFLIYFTNGNMNYRFHN